MSIQRASPINEILAKLIFLILPTMVVGYLIINDFNTYHSIPRTNPWQLATYLAAGMVGGGLFYAFRFRFLPTITLLILAFYVFYKGLDSMATEEFDSFFISVQFLLFSILFTAGWLCGWGFIRIRYWSIVIAALALASSIYLIAKFQMDSPEKLILSFSPILLYAIYIIFTAEQIYNYKDKSQRFWWYLTRRLFSFTILAILLLGAVVYYLEDEINEVTANYGGQGQEGENSMLKKNKDGRFDIKQYSKLRSNLGRSNELLFCAHIDNFFEGSDIPNPLYLTAFYYSKFDTLTETFERDATIPKNDLFEPSLTKIPVFFTKYDSSVIKNSLANKLRKTVEIEIYNKSLSTDQYLAPHTGYFVQPITVEKDYRDQFISAFRAKSYVSELNSAYFIYNSENEQIRRFQEQRFKVLREVTDYTEMDSAFMAYYTRMPGNNKFKPISDLAHDVTKDANTTVDKVLAIRDYFLAEDENGEKIYTYTDNPGIPDIPSASKLMYFLFDNKKGYCAYYAGATLFMLRSLGIPSRITVGFMTVDRSDKNKGWYWYYADQAHAWVQVYFPGYGWLDFDTTVGNSDAEESPQPDGTPPLQPPRAWLAADGIIERVDTLEKMMTMKVKHVIFHDKEYNMDSMVPVEMDLKIASVIRDSVGVALSNIQKGDEATAVSYAEAFKKMQERSNEKGIALVKRFPDPAPIDEVYLKRSDKKPEKDQPQTKPEEKNTLHNTIWIIVGLVATVLLVFFLIPLIIYWYYKTRYNTAKTANTKAYWAYRTACYYLHQIGIARGTLTPMQYANKVVDPKFNTSFGRFMNVYLKAKYAKQPLTSAEQELVTNFLNPFMAAVKKQVPFNKRFISFLNTMRSIDFFVKPEEDDLDKIS